ncbi:heat-shock protein Hsp70 [Synergistales bacterium]|nr:heat-shock protein Hsp70 [Synergistales bacterium]
MNRDDAVIGIDLGTRNALCAVLDERKRPVIIPNRRGKTSTPSVVGWDNGWVVGDDAVRLSLKGSASVWWDIKRKVGGDFRASCGGKSYSPEDILVPLLRSQREDAEVFLGQIVRSCVLAVPACFSLSQREALRRAAAAAGLAESRIVNEPTAAALAFGMEGRFLILDFGAGTVDVSVVESENNVWQVLESVGSPGLGGYDFDLALAEWLRERLRIEPLATEDPRRQSLIMEAENIKIALSSCESFRWTPPAWDGNSGGRDNSITVERTDIERLTRFSIRRMTHSVRRMWERYKPEHLLLVGGSSRIPLLHEILEKEITKPERLCLCAEESVAAGAALCSMIGEERLLLDVLSGDIGVTLEPDNSSEPKILAYAGSPLPISTRVSFGNRSAKKDKPTKIVVFQNMGDMNEDDAPARRTVLSELNIEPETDSDVTLYCELSPSGELVLRAKLGAIFADMPLFSGTDLNSKGKRTDGLKLRLASLEMSMSEAQKDKLCAVTRLIEKLDAFENGEAGKGIMGREIMEGLVKDLEAALLFQK